MYHYCMDVVVRPDPYYQDHSAEERQRGERATKIKLSAESEFIARKLALEQVYFSKFLVSRFLHITSKSDHPSL